MKINKTITGIVAAAACTAAIIGCKTLPTTDDTSKLGTAFGATAAYVLDKQVGVTNATTRVVIIDVVSTIDNYLPATNETCAAKWIPMVKALTDKYVAEGKLTQAQADRVVKDFSTISTWLDNWIDKKGIRPYQELVDSFVHSFSNSFLTHFKPANAVSAPSYEVEIDQEMYRYLVSNIK